MRSAALDRRILAILALIGLSACADRGPPPAPVAVTAVVTLDGKPLDQADVALFSDEAGQKHIATGRTGKTGECRLTHQSKAGPAGEGVIPGNYRVIVTKLAKQQARSGAPRSELPTRYADVHHSGLKAEVTPNADQRLRLELLSR